jgi:hypothetical protein
MHILIPNVDKREEEPTHQNEKSFVEKERGVKSEI